LPSAFAHAGVGATLATALPPAVRPKAFVLALAFFAAAPDLDVGLHHLGVPYHHPLGHRGFTHSILFACVAALAFVPVWRRSGASRPGLAANLTGAAILSHGLLDLFTDAGLGIGLFIPFENSRYFAPLRPLMTSPLSVAAFFQGRGLAILANETLWIGPPTLALAAIATLIRNRLSS